jgi:hypothetical protein
MDLDFQTGAFLLLIAGSGCNVNPAAAPSLQRRAWLRQESF